MRQGAVHSVDSVSIASRLPFFRTPLIALVMHVESFFRPMSFDIKKTCPLALEFSKQKLE